MNDKPSPPPDQPSTVYGWRKGSDGRWYPPSLTVPEEPAVPPPAQNSVVATVIVTAIVVIALAIIIFGGGDESEGAVDAGNAIGSTSTDDGDSTASTESPNTTASTTTLESGEQDPSAEVHGSGESLDLRPGLRTDSLRNAASMLEIEAVADVMCGTASVSLTLDDFILATTRVAADTGRNVDDLVHDAGLLIEKYCPDVDDGW